MQGESTLQKGWDNNACAMKPNDSWDTMHIYTEHTDNGGHDHLSFGGTISVSEMTHRMVWVHGMRLVWYGEVMAALSAVDPPVAGHVDAGC